MRSMEKMKKEAIRQMRAGAELYTMCEGAEEMMATKDELYSQLYLHSLRNLRVSLLEEKFELLMSDTEMQLWEDLLESSD